MDAVLQSDAFCLNRLVGRLGAAHLDVVIHFELAYRKGFLVLSVDLYLLANHHGPVLPAYHHENLLILDRSNDARQPYPHFSPGHVVEELPDAGADHRAAPDHRQPFLEDESDGRQLHAVALHDR